MKQKNAKIQSKQPTTEAHDTSQIPAQPEPVAILAKAEKPQPNRLQRFFRKVFIRLVVIAITFLAGIITGRYMSHKPMSETLTETQTALNQANQEIGGLQAETERLNTAIQEANNKITTLKGKKKGL